MERREVAGADEANDLLRRPSPFDLSLSRRLAPVVTSSAQVLGEDWNAPRISLGLLEQRANERKSKPNALHAQREPGLFRLDGKLFGVRDRAGIDAGLNPMQGHGMSRLAVVDRPARSVQPGIVREGTRVKVETSNRRRGDHVPVNDEKRMNVQQKIDVVIRNPFCECPVPDELGVQNPHSGPTRKIAYGRGPRRRSVRRKYGNHGMSNLEQHPQSLEPRRFFGDKQGIHRTSRAFLRRSRSWPLPNPPLKSAVVI